jgi:hypothetical protein
MESLFNLLLNLSLQQPCGVLCFSVYGGSKSVYRQRQLFTDALDETVL